MEKVLAQGEAWAQARCAGRASTSYCQRHSALHTDSTKWTYREALKLRRLDASICQCKRHVVRAAAPEQAETSLESIATTEDSLAQPEKIRRMPGRQTYKPASFQVLVQDATNAVKAAVADGLTRLEVEFPALPGNIDGKRWLYVQIADLLQLHLAPRPYPMSAHAGYKGASDWFIDSNIQLALAASKMVRFHSISSQHDTDQKMHTTPS